jgi:hypothetical protein
MARSSGTPEIDEAIRMRALRPGRQGCGEISLAG